MRTIRSFLALKLNLDTARAIAKVQTKLKDRFAEAGVRVAWVPPQNMHVTIRFLGQITEPMAYAIKDMLKPITDTTNAFEFELTGLGAFPNLDKPRVLWVGVNQGQEAIAKLHDSVYARLVEAGFNFDEKPFTAHVTIGRIKGGSSGGITSLIEEDQGNEFGRTAYPELICYRSDLSPKGAEYYALWHLPLVDREENKAHPLAMPGSGVS